MMQSQNALRVEPLDAARGVAVTYRTRGTCSRQIRFRVQDGHIHDLSFESGCSGNLQGLSKLCEGQSVDEVAQKLSGIRCRGNTSCPDQLSTALRLYQEQMQDEQ